VVPPFELGQMGKASCITDPAGVLVGLHYYNPPL
jgi:predicted enzyme related to lactoylglutathione lyase